MSAFQQTIEALARATGLDLVRLWRSLAGESPRVAAEAVAVKLAESSAEAYLRAHIMVARVVADALGEAPETPVVALDHFTRVERLAQAILTAAGYEWVEDGEPDDPVPEPDDEQNESEQDDESLRDSQRDTTGDESGDEPEQDEPDEPEGDEQDESTDEPEDDEPPREPEPAEDEPRRRTRLRLKEPEKADTRLERLGRSEVAQAAQMGVQEAMQDNPHVIVGWYRDIESDACQLCIWWARLEGGEPRVWPVTHPMPLHVGCVCVQRPVTELEYPDEVLKARRDDRASNAFRTLKADGTVTNHEARPEAVEALKRRRARKAEEEKARQAKKARRK